MEIPQIPVYQPIPQHVQLPYKCEISDGKLYISWFHQQTTLDNYLSQYTVDELNSITELNSQNSNISEINITQLPNLKILNMSSITTKVLNINNNKITKIICRYCAIETININASQLKFLNCENNYLTSVNINAPLLGHLNCSRNKIETLNISLPKLKILRIAYCNLKNLSDISANIPNIREIYCSDNIIETLSGRFEKLIKLDCSDNKIDNFANLHAPNLRKLYCNTNFIKSFDGLHYIAELYIKKNRISSLESLNNNQVLRSSLKILDCSRNTIPQFNINLPFLEKLYINNCWINILNIKCENLITLECENNNIKHTILDNPKLQILDISNNALTSFDGINAPNLIELECNHNKIKHFYRRINTNIPMTNTNIPLNIPILNIKLLDTEYTDFILPKLNKLKISYNNFSSFVGLYAPNLDRVEFFNTKITTLDFANYGLIMSKLQKIYTNTLCVNSLDFILDLPNLEYINVHIMNMPQKYLTKIRSDYFKKYHHKFYLQDY